MNGNSAHWKVNSIRRFESDGGFFFLFILEWKTKRSMAFQLDFWVFFSSAVLQLAFRNSPILNWKMGNILNIFRLLSLLISLDSINGLPDIIRIGEWIVLLQCRKEKLRIIETCLLFNIRWSLSSWWHRPGACLSQCCWENKFGQKYFAAIEIVSPNRAHLIAWQLSCIEERYIYITISYFDDNYFCNIFPVYSLPFITIGRKLNFWTAIKFDIESCAKYLWHNGNTTFGDPLGLQATSRKLSCEFVSASKCSVKGDFIIIYWFQTIN